MIVYDTECYPNFWCLTAESLDRDDTYTWEISPWRDDRKSLYEWFCFLQTNQMPMIGFNNLSYDYTMIHYIFHNIFHCDNTSIYEENQRYFANQTFGDDNNSNAIWERNRFAPQVDLFKIHHFDNRAKSTSLKALEINMRMENVMDLPFPPGTLLSQDQAQNIVIPYNRHDTKATKQFAHISSKMIQLRKEIKGWINGDTYNYSDTKIGKQLLIQKLGEICWKRNPATGKREPTQTYRDIIDLNEIVKPYIRFEHPEFNRILAFMRSQRIYQTKGVFEGVEAQINGFSFVFGTGGMHGSVSSKMFQSDAENIVVDIDVEGFYPSFAIVNQMAPAHLGQPFVIEYAALKTERAKHPKGTAGNATYKLASNSVFGDSGNPHSHFLDTYFMLGITINCQLLICMLAEWLMQVPTLKIIQINTDGITYTVNRGLEWYAANIQQRWQDFALLKLERVEYSRMWIRDVNNYVAEDVKGKLKRKGAYFAPVDANEIQEQSPPAWHKDFSNLVSVRAAVSHMTKGTPIESFIRAHSDPFDFMLRHKVKRDCELYFGNVQTQRTGRHFVSVNGQSLIKIAPVKEPFREGDYKKNNNCSLGAYLSRNKTGVHDSEIHTKNKSIYDATRTNLESGRLVTICNNAADFDFRRVDYDYYIREAQKLVIA